MLPRYILTKTITIIASLFTCESLSGRTANSGKLELFSSRQNMAGFSGFLLSLVMLTTATIYYFGPGAQDPIAVGSPYPRPSRSRPQQDASDCLGKVVGISDGDTLTVLCDGRKQRRIRLFGIDAPELGQPFGRRAKDELGAMVLNKRVRVISRGVDPYGRILAIVVTANDIHINEAMVSSGYAWWYQRFAPQAENLESSQESARKSHRGLWRDLKPVPPWQWRERERELGNRGSFGRERKSTPLN